MKSINSYILLLFMLGMISLQAEANGTNVNRSGGANATLPPVDNVAPNTSVSNDLINTFRQSVKKWYEPLSSIAAWLLLSLSVISFTWTAGQLALRNADLQEFVSELVRLILFTGFFMFLILNAGTLTKSIIDGFIYAGNQAASVSPTSGSYGDMMNPSEILARGFVLVSIIMDQGSWFSPGDSLLYFFVSIVVMIIYALISVAILLMLCEMYIVTAAGVLLLGFGGSQWTSEYAKKYITYCVSIGVKLFVGYLIIGIGETMILDWSDSVELGNIKSSILLVGVLLIILVLIKIIPDLIQGLISGTSLGLGSISVAGIAAAAGGAVAGAAVGTAKAGMAVAAASSLASDQKSSSGGLASMAGGMAGGVASGLNKANPLPGGMMQHAGMTMKNLGSAAKSAAAGKLSGTDRQSSGMLGGMNAALAKEKEALKQEKSGGGASSASSSKSSESSKPYIGGTFNS